MGAPHPGTVWERSLRLPVQATAEVGPFEPLVAAAARLIGGAHEALLVVASDGSRRPVGWLRARDVVCAAARDPESLGALQVRSAMSPCTVVCAEDCTPLEALQKLGGAACAGLVAVDARGRLLGSVSLAGLASLTEPLGCCGDAPQLAFALGAALAERSRRTARGSGAEVRDAMVSEVVTCSPDEPFAVVVARCYEREVSLLPALAVGEARHLVGITSARELCRVIVSHAGLPPDGRVGEAVRNKVASCWPDDSLEAAEAIMRAYRVRRLPVVDAAGALEGMLSLSDIARSRLRDVGDRQEASILETLRAIE